MRMGLLAFAKPFEPPPVDEKNVQPAVIIVIVERDPAASGLAQIFFLVSPPKARFRSAAGRCKRALHPNISGANRYATTGAPFLFDVSSALSVCIVRLSVRLRRRPGWSEFPRFLRIGQKTRDNQARASVGISRCGRQASRFAGK